MKAKPRFHWLRIVILVVEGEGVVNIDVLGLSLGELEVFQNNANIDTFTGFRMSANFVLFMMAPKSNSITSLLLG